MGLSMNGFREIYEPENYAEEMPSRTIRDELTSTMRMCAGAFQSMARLKPGFYPFRPSLLFFSRYLCVIQSVLSDNVHIVKRPEDA
jgi:hypothetical protein